MKIPCISGIKAKTVFSEKKSAFYRIFRIVLIKKMKVSTLGVQIKLEKRTN